MNLVAIRNEALAHGFDQTSYSGRMTQWINDCQNLIARRVDYYVDEATLTLTTTANVASFSFPADFARVRSLDDTDRNVELQSVNLRDIDRSATATGAPNFYAIDAQTIHLYPTPDSSTHNLRLRYWKMPAALVGDSDTPSIPADWHWLLWTYAVAQGYWAEDDAQMGAQWDQKFATGLSMFTADQRFPSSDGPNQARGMWDSEPVLSPAGGWTMYSGW